MTIRQHAEHNISSRMRITAVLALFIVLMFLLLSTYFIAHEADHDCSGKDCPVCALIQMSENNLRELGSGAPATAAAVSLIHIKKLLCMALSIMLLVMMLPGCSGQEGAADTEDAAVTEDQSANDQSADGQQIGTDPNTGQSICPEPWRLIMTRRPALRIMPA